MAFIAFMAFHWGFCHAGVWGRFGVVGLAVWAGVEVAMLTRLPLFGLLWGRKWLEIKPRAEKVCTTTPQLASLPEAVIRGGGCSGRVSFN